jgi:hypothetical protein
MERWQETAIFPREDFVAHDARVLVSGPSCRHFRITRTSSRQRHNCFGAAVTNRKQGPEIAFRALFT